MVMSMVRGERMARRTISASVFKATCLRLMDEIAASGDTLVITKNGKPVAELIPPAERQRSWIGALRGKVRITGDIEEPVEDPGAWTGDEPNIAPR